MRWKIRCAKCGAEFYSVIWAAFTYIYCPNPKCDSKTFEFLEKIEKSDVDIAIKLADNVFYHYARKVLITIGQSRDNQVEFVANIIRKSAVIERNVALKRSRLKAKDFDDVIETLIRRGDINIMSEKTGGRPKQKIFWVGD